MRVSFDVFRLYNPSGIDAQATVGAAEHERRALITLQLPVEPCDTDASKLAPVRLVISAAVTNASFPRAEDGDRFNVFEIGIGVVVGNVSRIAADISHGDVNGIEVLLA